MLAKAPLTHISVAGDQRVVSPKVKLYPGYITYGTLQVAPWLLALPLPPALLSA